MYLLTWHGTLLRVDNASQRLIQAPILPQRPNARDLTIPAHALAADEAVELAAGSGVVLHPGPDAATRHLKIGPRYAAARPGQLDVVAEDTEAGEHATFLVIPPEALAALRRLLRGVWTGDGVTLATGEIALDHGFHLRLGERRLHLAATSMMDLGGGGVFISNADASWTLTQTEAAGPDDDVFLRPITEATAAPLAEDAVGFATTAPSRLLLPGAPELCTPPLTQAMVERDWLYTHARDGDAPRTGLQVFACVAMRQRESYVMLASPAEGLVFDADGRTAQIARLAALRDSTLPFLSVEADAVFITRAALAEAPFVPGAVVVPYCQSPASPAAMLTDLLPRLLVLAPLLPIGVSLLLPQTACAEAELLLAQAGFGGLTTLRLDAPLCLADEVFALADQAAAGIPAAIFQSLRDRAAAPVPDTRTRLYLRGDALTVQNPVFVEAVARNHGFALLDSASLSLVERIEMFSAAEFVIAPQGDDLAWLTLCPPGTKVIELAPDAQYLPLYDRISSKLGLVHLVLPCPATPAGQLTVDPARFRAALFLLLSRL